MEDVPIRIFIRKTPNSLLNFLTAIISHRLLLHFGRIMYYDQFCDILLFFFFFFSSPEPKALGDLL